MGLFLFLLILAECFAEGSGYTRCTTSYYDSFQHRTITSYYRCSSRDYCCGSHSCCTPVYSRWYLWFVISSFFFIMLLIWWYYRYRYRPRHAATATAAPVVHGGHVSTRMTTLNHPYPTTGAVTVVNPNTGVVHYVPHASNFPQPGFTPYPPQPPPPYSAVVPNH